MTAEAIQKILDINHNVWKEEIEGRIYTDAPLKRLPFPEETAPEVKKFETLTGLKQFAVGFEPPVSTDENCLYFHVVSHNQVDLCGQIQPDNFNMRFTYATAKMGMEAFNFSSHGHPVWYDLEMFIISLQSLFMPTDDLDHILDNAGHIADENIIEHKDDRMAQSLVVKTGLASRGTAAVKNPVTLRPWRTFREVEQPESQFILRWQKASRHTGSNINVEASLWEADGGKWRLDAVRGIKEWLEFETKLKAIA